MTHVTAGAALPTAVVGMIPAVHAHLELVMAALTDARTALKAAAGAIAPPHHRTRPAPERWSAAEVLEHISLAEANFVSWISSGLARARAELSPSAADERRPLPEPIRVRMADRVNRREAPEAVRPTGQVDADGAWSAIEETERRLREALQEASALPLGRITVEHPRLGPFDIYQWVELIAAHRRRHVEQLQEIAEAVNGRAAPGDS